MVYLNIKAIRELREISIKKTALALGVSSSNYRDIENGVVDIKLSKLIRIAEVLDVNVSVFFETVEVTD
jgi:transcriptional regulator with XRE-family HTH domain